MEWGWEWRPGKFGILGIKNLQECATRAGMYTVLYLAKKRNTSTKAPDCHKRKREKEQTRSSVDFPHSASSKWIMIFSLFYILLYCQCFLLFYFNSFLSTLDSFDIETDLTQLEPSRSKTVDALPIGGLSRGEEMI